MKDFSSLMGENFLFKIENVTDENVTDCTQLMGYVIVLDEIDFTRVEF